MINRLDTNEREVAAYAFHMNLENMKTTGIELYLKNHAGIRLAQAFYSPECKQRVRCCMTAMGDYGVNAGYTVRNVDFVPSHHHLHLFGTKTSIKIERGFISHHFYER